jgi:hypothetical protein
MEWARSAPLAVEFPRHPYSFCRIQSENKLKAARPEVAAPTPGARKPAI